MNFEFLQTNQSIARQRPAAQAIAGNELAVTVTPSEHEKCERCWHYRTDVGVNPEHPTLCGRCDTNLHGSGEVRTKA